MFLPPNMQGLTDEQVEELKLRDEWGEKCVPSGGAVFKKDDVGRRNGRGKRAPLRGPDPAWARRLGQERSQGALAGRRVHGPARGVRGEG